MTANPVEAITACSPTHCRAIGPLLDALTDALGPDALPPAENTMVPLDRIPVYDFIKVGDEVFQYHGHVGGVMLLKDDRQVEHRYESTEGEAFLYLGGPF